MTKITFCAVFAALLLPTAVSAKPSAAPQPEVPQMNHCETAGIPPASIRTGWQDISGIQWTVIENGGRSSLCLYGNRYLIMKDQASALNTVTAKGPYLRLKFAVRQPASGWEYVVPSARLLSAIEPGRGWPAEKLIDVKLYFSNPDATTPTRMFIPVGANFDARAKKALAEFAPHAWLWAGQKTRNRLSDFLKAKQVKDYQAANYCPGQYGVELNLDFPRSYLAKYLEESANSGTKPKTKAFMAPAAELVCLGTEEKLPPRPGMPLGAFLGTLK